MSTHYILASHTLLKLFHLKPILGPTDVSPLRHHRLELGDLSFIGTKPIAAGGYGVVYLHTFSPPIIHRDVKSRNVLMDSKKGVKLTDFGISREYDDVMTNEVVDGSEVIKGTNYSEAADIYSFGVIFSPKSTRRYVLTEVAEGRLRPTMNGVNVPNWVKDIAQRCLQVNPINRTSALEVASILYHYKS
ncbi:kinase [Thraustotheca clavata]|uniref:Kinase n=1 Tax=Thraustotheca clavata TaxID=74557 RepID=A0A1V9Y8H1_9STRA|nr:kinase [Thraustotheca clavata]